jgi:sugar diacid utilization regulator
MDLYKDALLPYFDIDGTFQIALLSTGDLDIMDTVDRRRIGYQMQVYLENITHNASFFYYDSCFALVINAVPLDDVKHILSGFVRRFQRKNPDKTIAVGVSSVISDITNLHICYKRARAALDMAIRTNTGLLYFDDMGIYRLLSSVTDQRLLREMGTDTLQPIIAYDQKHNTNYVATLESYLKHNGSIQAVSEEMFTHRNTVIYRVNNIKKLLGCTLDTAEERMRYQLACLITHM